MRSTAPSGSPASYTDPKKIDAVLKTSDPEEVAASGRSYQKFAAAYEKIAGELLNMRSDLHDAWSGEPASAAAQSQLREVWSAVTTVHKTAMTFGVTIERHGSEHLAWYKYNKPPSKDLPEAQSWMTGANERVTQAWGSLPQDLSTSLPPGRGEFSHGPAVEGSDGGSAGGSDGGSDGGSAGGSAGGGGSAGASLHGGVVSHSSLAGMDDAGLPGASGTDLAEFSPPGVVGGAPGSVPLPGASGFNGVVGGLTPPLSGGGANLSAPGLVPPQGVLGVGPGGVGGGSAIRPPGVPGEVGPGRPGLTGPLGGGGPTEKKERTRQTWLAEEVWTEGITAAPQLIGSEGPAVEPEEPVEAPIEIDLSADGDALSAILADLDVETPDDAPQDVSTQISELRAQLARLERQRDAERGLPAAGEPTHDWLGGEDG
jgi:hypothetical protein